MDRQAHLPASGRLVRTATILGVVVLALIVAGAIGLAKAQRDTRESHLSRLNGRAVFPAQVTVKAVTESIRGLGLSLGQSLARGADDRTLSAAMQLVIPDTPYALAYDARGRLVAATAGARRSAGRPPRDLVVEVARTGRGRITDVLEGSAKGCPCVDYLIPIGRPGRALVVQAPNTVAAFQAFLSDILRSTPVGKGGTARLLDGRGRVVAAHPPPKTAAARITDGALLAAARRGGDGDVEGDRRYSARAVGASDWRSLVVAPEDGLLAGYDGFVVIGPWVLLAGLAVVLGGVAMLVGRLVRRTRQVEERDAALIRSAEYRSRFLATVSHDLRTPLTAVIGFADLLRDGRLGEVNERQRDAADTIYSVGRHAEELVGGLMAVGRIEAGELHLEPHEIELPQLLDSCAEALHPMAVLHHLKVITACDEAVRHVYHDPVRLRQVIFNYLTNAIKNSPPESKVEVRAEPTDSDRFRIVVSDEGPGLDPAQSREVFESYRQLRPGDRARGEGLGLAVAEQIVRAQGGRVGVDSVPGHGATFWADLPVRQPREMEPA